MIWFIVAIFVVWILWMLTHKPKKVHYITGCKNKERYTANIHKVTCELCKRKNRNLLS